MSIVRVQDECSRSTVGVQYSLLIDEASLLTAEALHACVQHTTTRTALDWLKLDTMDVTEPRMVM
jgi:hypothetical protein